MGTTSFPCLWKPKTSSTMIKTTKELTYIWPRWQRSRKQRSWRWIHGILCLCHSQSFHVLRRLRPEIKKNNTSRICRIILLSPIFNASVSSNFISFAESSIPTLFSLGLDLAVSLSLPQNFLASQIVRDSRIGYRWCFWFLEAGECRRSFRGSVLHFSLKKSLVFDVKSKLIFVSHERNK